MMITILPFLFLLPVQKGIGSYSFLPIEAAGLRDKQKLQEYETDIRTLFRNSTGTHIHYIEYSDSAKVPKEDPPNYLVKFKIGVVGTNYVCNTMIYDVRNHMVLSRSSYRSEDEIEFRYNLARMAKRVLYEIAERSKYPEKRQKN